MESQITGMKAHELEVGMEFSVDGGFYWYVVMTEPVYLSEESAELHFSASKGGSHHLSTWESFDLDDNETVHVRPFKG